MTEEELAMKEKLKVFNFSDEEIIIKTKEAKEQNAKLQAQIDEATITTTTIISEPPTASGGKGFLLLFGVVLVAVASVLIAKGSFAPGVVVAIISLIFMTLGLTKEELQEINLGARNGAMQCPHCKTKGNVHTKSVSNKKGISGGKATAAVITGGFSVLATGLSRKENQTEAHCTNCDSTWTF